MALYIHHLTTFRTQARHDRPERPRSALTLRSPRKPPRRVQVYTPPAHRGLSH